jgi:hypothetical protein
MSTHEIELFWNCCKSLVHKHLRRRGGPPVALKSSPTRTYVDAGLEQKDKSVGVGGPRACLLITCCLFTMGGLDLSVVPLVNYVVFIIVILLRLGVSRNG